MHWESQERLSASLMILCGLGIGECVGSEVIGYIQDHVGNRACHYTCLSLALIGTATVIWYIWYMTFSWVNGVVLCTVWGIQDGAVNVMLDCILGFQFDSKRTPFSVNKMVYSMFIFVFVFSQSFIVTRNAQIAWLLFCSVFQVFSIMLIEKKFVYRK